VTASSAVATAVQPLPDLSSDSNSTLTFNGFDSSGLHMDDNFMMVPGILPPLFDADITSRSESPFTDFVTSVFDEIPLDFSFPSSIPGLDLSQDYLSDQDNGPYGALTPMGPVVSPTLDDDAALSMLTTGSFGLSLPGPTMSDASDLDLPSNSELMLASQCGSSSTKDATLATAANATSALDANNSDLHVGQLGGPPEDHHAPRRTTRPHVPSMREHALNAIGSSCSRVRMQVADGKENNKRKVNPKGTVQRSNK